MNHQNTINMTGLKSNGAIIADAKSFEFYFRLWDLQGESLERFCACVIAELANASKHVGKDYVPLRTIPEVEAFIMKRTPRP